MQLHQQRVIEEKQELDEKLQKLEAFIDSDKFSSITSEERSLLYNQRITMYEYSEILGDRIALFTSTEESK